MLCLDTKLSETERCETLPENLPEVYIRNKFILKKYKHRNMWDPEINDYRKIGMDESLIGKTIRVASPMTCSCKDGICKNCYGDLYKTISKIKLPNGKEIRTNIGIVAVLLLTEVLTQMLLSTKHLLEAKTEEIGWNVVGIDKYFDTYQSSLALKDEIPLSSVKLLNYDEDEEITDLKINNKVIKLPIGVRLNNIYEVEQEDNDEYRIKLIDGIDDDDDLDTSLFTFTIKNKELSDPLNKINSLINSNKIKDRDLNGNINYMMELLDIVNFKISSEHVEVIMRELMDINDRSIFEMPNPEYSFVGAKTKVMNDSVTKSLLFERLKPQLLDVETYKKVNKDSLLDFLL